MIGRLTLRGLAAHKLRLTLTALAVVLGVAFVSGTLVFTDTLSKSFDKVFNNINTHNSVVVQPKQSFAGSDSQSSSGKTLPNSMVAKVRGVRGVSQAHGTVFGYAAVIGKNGKVVATQGPPQMGTSWDPDTRSDYKLTAGRAPRGPNEVVVDSGTITRAHYHVGQKIKLLLRGPSRTVRLVGVCDASKLAGSTLVAFDSKDAQRILLRAPGHWSSINVHAAKGVSQTTLRDRIRPILPHGDEAITNKKSQQDAASDVKSFLKYFNIILLVFAGIALFVGAFIIFNTFSMLVAQRTRELALLRAVGATRRQVTRTVVGEAFGVGIVAATVGLFAGFGLATGLRALMKSAGTKLPSTDLVMAPRTVIAAYAVGIIVTVAAAYFPARRGARIPPVAAMRDDVSIPSRSLRIRVSIGAVLTIASAAVMTIGLRASGSTAAVEVGAGAAGVFIGVTLLAPVISKPVVHVLGGLFPSLFRVSGKLGKQNALRNPRRTAATSSALMIGLALVSTMAILGATMKTSINHSIDKSLGADYVVSSSNYAPFTPSAARRVAKAPSVSRVTSIKTERVKLGGKVGGVMNADVSKLKQVAKLKISSGSAALGSDGILMDKKTATAKGWHVGSAVPLQFPDGSRQTVHVTGVYKKNQLVQAPLLSSRVYDKHFPDRLDTELLVNVDHPGTAAKHHLDAALHRYPNLVAMDHSQIKRQSAKQVNQLIDMVQTMLVLSIIIAALGILNTLALSVVERTREIGLLRAVGMSRRQMRRTVRLEAFIVAVFGAVLGVAVGLLFGWALQHALKSQGLTILSIPGGQLVAYIVVSGVIGILAAVWPAWRAARLNILRAIYTE